MQLSEYKLEFALGIIQSRRSGCVIVLFLATRYFPCTAGFDNYRLPISRYRRHYGSKVNRSKKRKQDVIALVNTVTQFIHRGSYAHIVTVVRKFS